MKTIRNILVALALLALVGGPTFATKTLTTSITLTNSFNNIQRWQVVGFEDNDTGTPPNAKIQVQFIGGGGKIYPPGQSWTLYAYDSTSTENFCLSLAVNPYPVTLMDQLIYTSVSISGAYTSVTTAYYGASGKTAARNAVEAALLTTGLLPSDFAGS